MDYRRQHRTRKHSEKRIFEHYEHVAEGGNIRKPGNSTGHCIHSEHQRCKTEQNCACILLFVRFSRHQKNHSDQCKHGCERCGFQKLNEDIAA